MALQTRRRIDPGGSDTYLRVRVGTARVALLGLERPRTSRDPPIKHLIVMRHLCKVLGHKVPKGRRFFLTERRARCVRCGKRVRVKHS